MLAFGALSKAPAEENLAAKLVLSASNRKGVKTEGCPGARCNLNRLANVYWSLHACLRSSNLAPACMSDITGGVTGAGPDHKYDTQASKSKALDIF